MKSLFKFVVSLLKNVEERTIFWIMRRRKKPAPSHSIATLETDAARHLSAHRYKAAINTYKQLLRKEQRPEWRQALGDVYLQEACSLADNGMYREAAVSWENQAVFGDGKQYLDSYITWLVRAGRHIKAANLYAESADQLPGSETARQLPALFGALMLAGTDGIADAFPPETPWLAQQQAAKNALLAYCRGDNDATETCLGQISFRSPYRDFRTILKALLAMETDPAAAGRLLEKVPAHSPYARLVELIQMNKLNGQVLGETLEKLAPGEQTFVACLKGWDQNQIKLFQAMRTAIRRGGGNKALLDMVLNNRRFLGEEYSSQFCRALLPGYPEGIKAYERVFKPLPPFACARIEAIRREQQNDYSAADRHWQHCVNILKRDLTEPESARKAALILRHLVETGRKYDVWKHEELFEERLEESLRLDPDDKPTYIKLIEYHKKEGKSRQKPYQKWVDTAIKHFPKDSEMLMEAMNAATAKKAFKKAAGFAKTLLKEDPINLKARRILFSSHVSHARKLIKMNKHALAAKELEQAAGLERSGQHSGVVQINQGLLALQTARQTGKKLDGAELLQQGIELAGSEVCGCFRVFVEAKSLKLPEEPSLHMLPPIKKSYVCEQREVLDLAGIIEAYYKQHNEFIKDALEEVKTPVKNAAARDFSRKEMLSTCQCFYQINHYELLLAYSDAALKHWPKEPAFICYQISGKTKDDMNKVTSNDLDRLKNAGERAKEQGDKRSTVMIGEFLEKYQASRVPVFPGFPGLPIFPGFPGGNSIEDEMERRMAEIEDMGPEQLARFLLGGKISPQKIAEIERMGPEGLSRLLMERIGVSSIFDLDEFEDEFDEDFDEPPRPRSRRRKTRRR
ncbi:MAG: hypothetical protein GY862_28340 [Gammaproteobacteria bacterium]|nr:hypothetical protein [Gammaproteobacteria bacterium]